MSTSVLLLLEIRIHSVEPRAVDAGNGHDTDDLAIADPRSYSTKVADVLRRLAIDVYGVFPISLAMLLVGRRRIWPLSREEALSCSWAFLSLVPRPFHL